MCSSDLRFTDEMAASVEDAELRPLAEMLSHLPTMQVDETVAAQVKNGRSLGQSSGSGQLAIVDGDGQLIAVYESRDGEFRPVKVLVG